jgi:hypothetical protein
LLARLFDGGHNVFFHLEVEVDMVLTTFVRSGFLIAPVSVAESFAIERLQHWHGKHAFHHDLAGVQKFHTTAAPRVCGTAVVSAIL